MNTIRKFKEKSGFSIIEIVSVIAIMMILIGLLTPALRSARRQAKKKKAEAIIGSLEVAINMYFTDIGDYPTLLSALVTDPGVSGWLGPYMDSKRDYYSGGNFQDPWGANYSYNKIASVGTGVFDLWSYGPDGTNESGAGDDITNW